MPAIRLWIETTHHAAFRYGGWAYVRAADGAVAGVAGGERGIAAERLDLTALVAMLTGLPTDASVAVSTSSLALQATLRLAANPPGPGSDDAPADNLDLWAALLTLAKGKTFSVRVISRAPQTPAAFLAAWAEVGQDKAKGLGRFSAAIPKPNLAKLNLG